MRAFMISQSSVLILLGVAMVLAKGNCNKPNGGAALPAFLVPSEVVVSAGCPSSASGSEVTRHDPRNRVGVRRAVFSCGTYAPTLCPSQALTSQSLGRARNSSRRQNKKSFSTRIRPRNASVGLRASSRRSEFTQADTNDFTISDSIKRGPNGENVVGTNGQDSSARNRGRHRSRIVGKIHKGDDLANLDGDGDGGDVVVFHEVNGRGQGERQEVDSKTEVSDETERMKVATSFQYQRRTKSTVAVDRPKRGKSKKKPHKLQKFGEFPDVHWRAIPMEHLRSHPFFEPLPHPDTITRLETLEDVRHFRQDSWQWDALHTGRCTTSQAAAALGFLEAEAGRELGIPRSLRSGGIKAYHRLSQPSLRCLEEMNRVLCTGGNGLEKNQIDDVRKKVWGRVGNDADNRKFTRPYPFAARYLQRTTQEELKEKKQLARRFSSHSPPYAVRMSWGDAQEATAVLTALNYFWKKCPGVVVKEVGMCGAGLNTDASISNANGAAMSLVLGATPDGVLHYPDGALEALEVKNHCPFVPKSWMTSRKPTYGTDVNGPWKSGEGHGIYGIRESFLQPKVPAGYIPQLMMEMLCLGPQCRSAVMVRQTATSGAVILRLHRDDAWIDEMLHWLNKFTTEFVQQGVPPPSNFFWNDEGKCTCGNRYRAFLQWTKKIGDQVELVDYVGNKAVQRVVSANQQLLPLFLD